MLPKLFSTMFATTGFPFKRLCVEKRGFPEFQNQTEVCRKSTLSEWLRDAEGKMMQNEFCKCPLLSTATCVCLHRFLPCQERVAPHYKALPPKTWVKNQSGVWWTCFQMVVQLLKRWMTFILQLVDCPADPMKFYMKQCQTNTILLTQMCKHTKHDKYHFICWWAQPL